MTSQSKNKTNLPSQFEDVSQAYRQIAKLAYAATSRHAFFHDAMICVGRLFTSPYTMLYAGVDSEVFDDYYHEGTGDPAFWKPVVQESLNDLLADGQSNLRFFSSRNPNQATSLAVMSAVVYRSSGASVGGMVVVTPCANREQADMQHKLLESIVNLISCCSDLSEAQLAQGNDKLEACKRLSQAANYATRQELAFAVTNNLRNRTGCEQVAFGHVKKGQVDILSVSGLDELRKRGAGMLKIRDAMEECLDLDIPLVYQKTDKKNDESAPREYRLHRQWHEAANHAAVASIPLHGPHGCTAVLSLKRHASQPFKPEELDEIRTLTEPYTAVFGVIEKANRNIIEHLTDSLRNGWLAALKPDRWLHKVAVATLILITTWFCLGSMNYNITVSGRITPRQVRHIAAPFTGTLAESFVTKGDTVKTGDILCRLDTRDLTLMEREKLTAQLKIAQIEQRHAQGNSKNVEAELAQANLDLIQAKLDILDRMIEQATLKAPFDGVVVEGDLRKRTGEVLPQSEPLFQIAAQNNWILELDVPENLAADIESDLTGCFISNARPGINHDIRIETISPGPELRHNRNVYVAEADVDFDHQWVKSGMEGVAKVTVGRRRVCWVVLHKIIDYLHLKFWL